MKDMSFVMQIHTLHIESLSVPVAWNVLMVNPPVSLAVAKVTGYMNGCWIVGNSFMMANRSLSLRTLSGP